MDFEKNQKQDKHKFRRFFSQFVVATVKSLHNFTVGICFSLPTIIIAALTIQRNDHNKDEFLAISAVQASWLASFWLLLKLAGSLLSTLLTDTIGRRLSMIVVSIPFIVGFFMLYLASSVQEVFVGFAFFGIANGLINAPILSYLVEISEPSYRGTLMAYGHICISSGAFMIYLLNTMMPWRKVCLVCANVPLVTAIATYFIPETPQYLLSKNRVTEAKKSLCWLRGWVSYEDVAQEFDDLHRQSERSKSCHSCIKHDLKCVHSVPTMSERFTELKRKPTLKPFFIIVALFFLVPFSGILPMRPYMLQIFEAYNSPIQPDKAMTILSIMDGAGTVTMMLLIRFSGKRQLYLFGMSAVLVCSTIVTWYGFTFLPGGYVSFDQANYKPFQSDNSILEYIPTICLMMWSYFTCCSIATVPLILLSELFSFKSRGIASGVAISVHYIFNFIGNKIYYNLETALSLPGISLMYTCITFLGLILMYNIFPETEGRSLEEIELHFADNSKRLTDRKIAISKHQDGNQPLESGNKVEVKSLMT